MNNSLRFLKSVGINALAAVLFYAWKVEGSEGSGNIVLFWFWFGAVFGILAMSLPASGKQNKRIKWIERFNAVAQLAFVVAFAYFGHFLLAACCALGALGCRIYRDRFDDEGLPLQADAK